MVHAWVRRVDAGEPKGVQDNAQCWEGQRGGGAPAYAADVYLVTAFVPSDTACFASSPGSSKRTAV